MLCLSFQQGTAESQSLSVCLPTFHIYSPFCLDCGGTQVAICSCYFDPVVNTMLSHSVPPCSKHLASIPQQTKLLLGCYAFLSPFFLHRVSSVCVTIVGATDASRAVLTFSSCGISSLFCDEAQGLTEVTQGVTHRVLCFQVSGPIAVTSVGSSSRS